MTEEVVVLALCESQALVLRPNVLYRFKVVDNCTSCKEIAAQTSN